ncbi:exosortase F system-associated membrane protein [Mangrovimonas spongiae]|uniref:Exosortase F system-associated protein n=1 Tax=Mangrovimonas spongiae TaxID=2494697 RepID=A0A3R9MGJ6_9FLAO|nr:exosortase F system-associated protein [Mangrovimonas spongiae]RSK39942.1 exosortase F system-associated protein [Mangrovimonas spongiae]
MQKKYRFLVFIVLVSFLILIRAFENQLFYDPYLLFFKNDYLYADAPKLDMFKLVVSITLRYTLNTIISLGILYVIFVDKSMVEFSLLIYTISYVILILLFLYFITNHRQEDYYLFFNIRRFLIQPILLLLLVPAFYYHKRKKRIKIRN